jgi:uncharacterized membrane protein YraQ (UPF0718 family)
MVVVASLVVDVVVAVVVLGVVAAVVVAGVVPESVDDVSSLLPQAASTRSVRQAVSRRSTAGGSPGEVASR